MFFTSYTLPPHRRRPRQPPRLRPPEFLLVGITLPIVCHITPPMLFRRSPVPISQVLPPRHTLRTIDCSISNRHHAIFKIGAGPTSPSSTPIGSNNPPTPSYQPKNLIYLAPSFSSWVSACPSMHISVARLRQQHLSSEIAPLISAMAFPMPTSGIRKICKRRNREIQR